MVVVNSGTGIASVVLQPGTIGQPLGRRGVDVMKIGIARMCVGFFLLMDM